MNGEKKVFAFHGAEYKVGSTMLTQSIAQMIANGKKDKKVLLLFLNGRRSTDYCREDPESIEAVRASIDNKMLTLEEFMRTCHQSENLYMLAGVCRLFEQRLYGPQMSEYLIDLVREAFDLILIDCGNELDNGLALGALRRSDVRLLVVTQQESVLARYEALRSTYEMLKISYQKIIVNKYIQDDPHDEAYLARRLHRHRKDMVAVLLAKYARQAEIDYRTLLEYNEAGFRDGIREAARIILEESGMGSELNAKAGWRWKSFI